MDVRTNMKADIKADIEQQLISFSPYCSGNVLAAVVAVKGMPGAAENAGELPFSGADGLALDKAFGSLGWGFGSQDTRVWFGLLLAPLGLPTLTAQQLRLICEIVDPLVIAALDEAARIALIEALAPLDAGAFLKTGTSAKAGASTNTGTLAGFHAGAEAYAMGRHLVSVDGFEDALADEKSKQRAWAQLKRCKAPGQ